MKSTHRNDESDAPRHLEYFFSRYFNSTFLFFSAQRQDTARPVTMRTNGFCAMLRSGVTAANARRLLIKRKRRMESSAMHEKRSREEREVLCASSFYARCAFEYSMKQSIKGMNL